LNTQTK